MKLKNMMKYGMVAAAISMMVLCAPLAAYAETPDAEVAEPESAVAAAETPDDNGLFTGMRLSESYLTLMVRSMNRIRLRICV